MALIARLIRRWFWWVSLAGAAGCIPPALAVDATGTEAASQEAASQTVNVFQAVVLGMVQGLTEFIPISSTAHLKVVPVMLGWGDPGVSFIAVIQLGSIAAVLWYFWGDLSKLVTGTLRAIAQKDYQASDLRMSIGIAIGTLPIVVVGLALKFLTDYDNSPLRSLAAIATASILMSLLMGFAEKASKHARGFEELGMRDGILMGCAQALALVPGVSRSGATITAGLFQGLQRGTAARFSFLMGLPAITLAGLVESKELIAPAEGVAISIPVTIAGLISAAVFSYLAIAWLIRYLQTKNTWVFVWYRLIFGVGLLGAIALQLPWTIGE